MSSRMVLVVVAIWAALMVMLAITWYTLSVDSFDSMAGVQAAALCWVIVGAILTIKVPTNLVGPLALGAGSAWVIYLFGNSYGAYSLTTSGLPGDYFSAWLGAWVGALLPIGVSMLILVFPTGRTVGWWGLVMTAPLAGLVSTIVGAVLLWGLPLPTLINVEMISQVDIYSFVDAGFIIGFVSTIPAVFSMVSRYRRGGLDERQQIKWLLTATVLFALVYLIAATLDDSNGTFWWLLSAALAAIPLAIIFAVLRYRLYDIDRIISRTVTYAMVVGLIGLGVAAVATMAGSRFETPWVVATTTLAVAAVFNPLRRRVQNWVDRRFNRSRYDAERVMDELGDSLRSRVETSEVIEGWVDVVATTLQPGSVGVWIKPS